MSAGAWAMVLATALALGALLFVIGTMIRSIIVERRASARCGVSSASAWP